MRDTAVMERSSKHRKKKHRSQSADLSEEALSESDEKMSKNVELKRRHSSNSSESSPERVKKQKKKRKKHKRRHKQTESDDDVEEVHIEKSSSPELVELEQDRSRKTYSEEREASLENERRRVDDRKRHDKRHHRERDASVENERRDVGRRDEEEERRKHEKRREDVSVSCSAVRIKHEPIDEDESRVRHSHSSSRHRPTEGRRDRSDDAEYQSSRHRQRREGDGDRPSRDGHRSRKQERDRGGSAERGVGQDNRRENTRHNEDRSRHAPGDDEGPTTKRPAQRERRQSEERERRRSEDRERRQSQDRERRRSEERIGREANRGQAERGGRGGRGRGGRGGRSRFDAGRQDRDDGATFEWGKASDNVKQEPSAVPPGEKEKPNFGTSGKLTEEVNTFKGVVIKYSEPPEARKPRRRWRFYPFKGEKGLQTLYIHRQSSYLIGRDRKIADIPVDHPSCSKQHAALQYRLVPFERENGTTGKRVRPYIIDLESANGTFVNNVKIDAKKYVELLERDVVKFGFSSREYVLLHEQSKDDDYDDVGDLEDVPDVPEVAIAVAVAESTQRAAPVRLQPLAPLID